MSSRRNIYVDYLGWLNPASAKRILILFLIGLLVAELCLRILNPQYSRTAVSSLHGTRAIFQQAIEYREAKIIAVGDSTLVGGGVYDHNKTVMGLLANALETKPRLFNLAVPGGDATTSTLLLDSVKKAGVKNVERVIIEVIPSKFRVYEAGAVTSKDTAKATAESLQRYIPFINPQAFGLDVPKLPYTDQFEVAAEWMLGNLSMLYRHRDFLRTEYVGNYPALWFVGTLIPRPMLARLFPSKAEGTNRLAARTDDFPFKPEFVSEPNSRLPRFTPHTQGDYLEQAVAIAKNISSKPPIILSFPTHYEYDQINTEQRHYYLRSLQEYKHYLETVAAQSGSELVVIPSEKFQAPELWTRTPAHFNARGSMVIWKMMQPQLCSLYPSTCKSQSA